MFWRRWIRVAITCTACAILFQSLIVVIGVMRERHRSAISPAYHQSTSHLLDFMASRTKFFQYGELVSYYDKMWRLSFGSHFLGVINVNIRVEHVPVPFSSKRSLASSFAVNTFLNRFGFDGKEINDLLVKRNYDIEACASFYGWPFPSVWSAVVVEIDSPKGGKLIQSTVVAGSENNFMAMAGNASLALPTEIIWMGLSINVMVVALFLAAVWQMPLFIRRWLRHRHGLCRNCGYPVQVADRCAECGRDVGP